MCLVLGVESLIIFNLLLGVQSLGLNSSTILQFQYQNFWARIYLVIDHFCVQMDLCNQKLLRLALEPLRQIVWNFSSWIPDDYCYASSVTLCKYCTSNGISGPILCVFTQNQIIVTTSAHPIILLQ